MSFEGKSGSQLFQFAQAPSASQGSVKIQTEKGELEAYWKVDAQGLRLVIPSGAFDFDWEPAETDDADGLRVMRLRGSSLRFKAPAWIRKGEERLGAGAARSKKAHRVRAQMPGKVVRILVEAGGRVEHNQPIAIIEAMKMENEIRSPLAGKVEQIFVKSGQALESGAELFLIQGGESG